jgi:predicted dehydrogenase
VTPTAIRDVSVLIAGCGSIGRRHARVLRSLGVRDIRVCDPAAEQRAALKAEGPVAAEFSSYAEALASRPQSVFICTPPKLHIPMSIEALESGAHVFSEKPLSDSLAGVEALDAAIRRTRRKFMVGFCFRYHEGLTRAKALLDAGRIGRLVSIRCRMGEHLPTVRPDYKGLFSSQYSGAFDLTHEIDLACWYAAPRPISAVKCLSGSFSDIGIRAPDVVEILVRFGGDCLASVHLDFFSRPRSRVTELLGTEGVIAVEFPTWEQCELRLYSAAEARWTVERLTTERDFMFRAEDTEFLEAVALDRPIRLDLAEACKSMRIVTEAQGNG